MAELENGYVKSFRKATRSLDVTEKGTLLTILEEAHIHTKKMITSWRRLAILAGPTDRRRLRRRVQKLIDLGLIEITETRLSLTIDVSKYCAAFDPKSNREVVSFDTTEWSQMTPLEKMSGVKRHHQWSQMTPPPDTDPSRIKASPVSKKREEEYYRYILEEGGENARAREAQAAPPPQTHHNHSLEHHPFDDGWTSSNVIPISQDVRKAPPSDLERVANTWRAEHLELLPTSRLDHLYFNKLVLRATNALNCSDFELLGVLGLAQAEKKKFSGSDTTLLYRIFFLNPNEIFKQIPGGGMTWLEEARGKVRASVTKFQRKYL